MCLSVKGESINICKTWGKNNKATAPFISFSFDDSID